MPDPNWKSTLGLAIVILGILGASVLTVIAVLNGIPALFNEPPPGGSSAYCYRVTYDPRGSNNQVEGFTNLEPDWDGNRVALRDIWLDEDSNLTDRFHHEDRVDLLTTADVRIEHRC